MVLGCFGKETWRMAVISVVAQKGGVGKTTVCQCFAVEALRQGMAAAIIDTDPQRSATEWGEHREAAEIDAPTVIALGSKRLRSVIDDLKARGAVLIIIDTPPHSAPAINAALEVSTGAVMVTRPNPMDVRALEATWGIVGKIKKPAAAVFTQAPPGARARALGLAIGRLDALGIPHCPTPLTYTLSFPYAQAEALAVQEREPTSKARAEVAEVWSWFRRSAIF
jgi:chromosome partitioning protein